MKSTGEEMKSFNEFDDIRSREKIDKLVRLRLINNRNYLKIL